MIQDIPEEQLWSVELPTGDATTQHIRAQQYVWLRENVGESSVKWYFKFRIEGGRTFYFIEENDALLFKLVWGGQG